MPAHSKLSMFSIAMIAVSAIFTLRSLPLMAVYGLSAVFYYLLFAIIFLIPSALVCAELATGWPKTGGLYVWISEAFGKKFGFLAIWLEWINTTISFPATLSFIVASLAFAIAPSLIANKYYLFIAMFALFWSATFINFFGIKFSSTVSTLGLMLGTVFPFLVITLLSLWWLFSHHPSQITFSWQALMPSTKASHLSLLAGLMLCYSGMQIVGFHAQETKNPQRDFPKGILIAVLIILLLSIVGSLAISIIVPQKNISVVIGIMQAGQSFFNTFHMTWMFPIFAVLTAVGTLAMLNMWVIGPSKGLLATAQDGELPRSFRYRNKHGAPVTILFVQAIIATVCSGIYLLIPSINNAYWILIVLSALLTLLMYVLLFAAVIRLRYSHPHIPRAYKIPGGMIGVWLVGGTGLLACLTAFFLGFVPPIQLKTGNPFSYEKYLAIGTSTMLLVPFLFFFFQRKKTLLTVNNDE
ncbi:MAG: APC family permease [Gammaproteobacteria bacterium]|nr:APC family permease [Gammaproteobacteria bacterium]MBU1559086.1 APC family permease [Gammaproteobacteria bacterium]MBU1926620.1 APC family permease [Gammaproteobacteria bacterium]MBU2545812.1 APC family permease [Gammaproteobacteria bacterium]